MIDSNKMVEETEKTQKETEETQVEDKKEEESNSSEENIDNLKQDGNSESLEEEKSNSSDLEDTDKEKVEEKKEVEEEDKDNIIFVGIKPFMNYVTGVVMQFQNKGQDEVIVSARGKFISKAVDIAEVARRTFLKDEDIKIDDISVTSEQFENKEGRRIFVSAIEIKLVRG